MNEYKVSELSEKYLNWTPTAVECFERGGNCRKCPLHEILETECLMKYIVIRIVKFRGKPPKREEIDIEKIIDLLENGKTIKETASIMGMSLSALQKITKAKGINGYLLKDGEYSKWHKVKRRKRNDDR